MTTVWGYLNQLSTAASDSPVFVENAIAPVVSGQGLQVPGRLSTKGRATDGYFEFQLGFGTYYLSVPGAKVTISVTEDVDGESVSFDQLIVSELPTPQAPVGGSQATASASVTGIVRTDETPSVNPPIAVTGMFWKDAIAGVRAIPNRSNNKVAFMLRGAEAYHWDAAALDTDDSDWVLKPSDTDVGDPGRFRKRVSPGMGMVNVLDHGVKGDGTTDDTAKVLEAAAVAPEGAQLWFPPNKTYILDGLVLDNVGIRGPVTAVLKHKANATSNMISYTTASRCVVEGVTLDGNKANQVLTGASHTRYACLQTFSDGMVVRDCVIRNYTLAGINDFNTETELHVENVWFLDGAEHGGTYRATGRGTEQSSAILVSANTADTNPHFYISNCRVYQSAAPSTTGKAPGGFIFAGVLADNAIVTPIVVNCRFMHIGQTFPRTGDANHIGCVDFYEGTAGGMVSGCQALECEYGAFKIQNSFAPRIVNNYISGAAAGILEGDGVAGILVDVNRTLGDATTDYGRAIISGNQIFNMGDSPCIRVAGRGTDADDSYTEVIICGNYCDNAAQRALQLANVAGKLTSFGNTYRGEGPSGSSGAVEVQNLRAGGTVKFRNDTIIPTGQHGIYASSGISGSISIHGCEIKNGGSGTTCIVVSAAERVSVKNNAFDGTGGGAWNIAGAGTLEWGGNHAVAGTRTITWANVGNAEGDLEGSGTPEAVVMAVKGRATFRRTDGGAGTTFYVKETDSGSASNTGWGAK